MSLINNSFCKFIIVACRTEFKKCCFYIVFLQYFQNFWCCITVWAKSSKVRYIIFLGPLLHLYLQHTFLPSFPFNLNFSFLFLCYYFSFLSTVAMLFYLLFFHLTFLAFCTVAELYIQMFACKHCKFRIYHSLFSYFLPYM